MRGFTRRPTLTERDPLAHYLTAAVSSLESLFPYHDPEYLAYSCTSMAGEATGAGAAAGAVARGARGALDARARLEPRDAGGGASPAPATSLATTTPTPTTTTAPTAALAAVGGVATAAVLAVEPAVSTMRQCKWYVGDMPGRAAEEALAKCEDGAFLVRESPRKPGHHSLSIKYSGHIAHLRIFRKGTAVGFTHNPDVQSFEDIPHLVAHFERHSLYSCFPALPTKLGESLALPTRGRRRVPSRCTHPRPPSSSSCLRRRRLSPRTPFAGTSARPNPT